MISHYKTYRPHQLTPAFL